MSGISGSAGGGAARGDLSIPSLRAAFRGRVIAPGDADYDEARAVFYGGIDHRPAVIIRAADDSDVSGAISLARETGLELAVRSGGHSPAGHGVSEGGIVLDLSAMRALHIDAESHTAWAQPGLTAGEYTTATAAHGLATGFGDTASVGIGGITLSGGIGLLTRRYGLTIDSLLAADIVTADGQLLRTDATSHPDLFWAIRGGGGNLGVATRFLFRLYEVDTIMGGALVLPASPELIQAFVATAQAAPDELTTVANVMPAPPMPFVPAEYHGQLAIVATLVHSGPPDAGERAIAPFRALATPIADVVRPMRYHEALARVEGPPRPIVAARATAVDAIDRPAAEAIVDHLRQSTAVASIAQIRVLGGAAGRVLVDATAFAHRTRGIMVNVIAVCQREKDRPLHDDWASRLVAALSRGDAGVYVGWLGDEGAARVREAYPGLTWDRLRSVKARYDPTNLFRLNQNVPPADGRALPRDRST